MFYHYVCCADCLSLRKHPCLQWVDMTTSPEKSQLIWSCESENCNTTYKYIGRTVSGDDLPVGKCNGENRIEFGTEAGEFGRATEGYVLRLQPNCNVRWEDYSAGDPIPDGAVVGGYIGDSCGGVYIVRAKPGSDENMPAGYYNPKNEMSYIATQVGSASLTDVSILIISSTINTVGPPTGKSCLYLYMI